MVALSDDSNETERLDRIGFGISYDPNHSRDPSLATFQICISLWLDMNPAFSFLGPC